MRRSARSISHVLVVDLEATCCNRGSLNKDTIEIIEIGAFLIEIASLEVCFDFHQFVRPIKSLKITPFCTRLTGIKQSDVKNAPDFPEMVHDLSQRLFRYPETIFACWSNFDWRQFHKDCKYHQIDFPFHNEYWDLQKLFRRKQKQRQLHSVKGALEAVGLEFKGREHSAYYDALNTTKLLPFCIN